MLPAKDGREAVELFLANRERIDVFLLDVVMLRMGGSEAYERICEITGAENVAPLIFMTGYSSETVQSRFVKARITAEKLRATVIRKPYDLNKLGQAIRKSSITVANPKTSETPDSSLYFNAKFNKRTPDKLPPCQLHQAIRRAD